MDTPTPLSVQSVLLSAQELLTSVRQELERASFRHRRHSKELRQLRAVATALTSRRQQLSARGEDAPLWQISELLTKVRDLDQRMRNLAAVGHEPE